MNGLKSRVKNWLYQSQFRLLQDVRYELHLQFESLKNNIFPGRILRRRMMREARAVKLHWGCGMKHHVGWTNIDGWAAPSVDYIHDMRKPLPLAENSVSMIFTEHVLEHFSHTDGSRIVRDFHRILQPGGIVRIIVPDLEIFIERYTAEDSDFMRDTWTSCETRAEVVNTVFYEHFHRAIYDYGMLRLTLKKAGFTDVRKAGFRDSKEVELNLDTDENSRIDCSMYVEAIKGPFKS